MPTIARNKWDFRYEWCPCETRNAARWRSGKASHFAAARIVARAGMLDALDICYPKRREGHIIGHGLDCAT